MPQALTCISLSGVVDIQKSKISPVNEAENEWMVQASKKPSG